MNNNIKQIDLTCSDAWTSYGPDLRAMMPHGCSGTTVSIRWDGRGYLSRCLEVQVDNNEWVQIESHAVFKRHDPTEGWIDPKPDWEVRAQWQAYAASIFLPEDKWGVVPWGVSPWALPEWYNMYVVSPSGVILTIECKNSTFTLKVWSDKEWKPLKKLSAKSNFVRNYQTMGLSTEASLERDQLILELVVFAASTYPASSGD
jgi:hypothetical protein